MPKEEWGVKRICPTTGKRFYDLNKSPIVSPYTGEIVDLESARRKASSVVSARVAREKDEDEDLVDDLDTDEDLLATESTDDVDLEEDLLEEDDDDTVSLDDLTDVAGSDDEG